MNKWLSITGIPALMLLMACPASAKVKHAPPVRLSPHGQKLEARYSAMLLQLRRRIVPALPKIPPGLKTAFMKLYRAEAKAKPYRDNSKPFAESVAACLRAAQPILNITNSFLASHKLQTELIQASVIAKATPLGLARFAQRSHSNADLIRKLLDNPALMQEMQVADGAKHGDYGRTMQIYTAIEKASPQARQGILQRLALGTSLEQKPVLHWPGYDPVTRFLDYQKAYLNGELDPAFPQMTTWDCRFITDDPFTTQEIDWFRTMLRNYEPGIIFLPHYKLRYLDIVHTDVRYCHPHWGIVPGSRAAQLLAGGGECGPRAWLGRLATQAFGIPTWGVRQRGHAAMSHWTPHGWATAFGANWRWNWWDGRRGLDFYFESQARRFPQLLLHVLRAQWVGAVLGEKKPNGMVPGTDGFWYALANNQERAIVASGKPFPVGLTDQQLAVRNGPTAAQKVENAPIPISARQISIAHNGVIHIPAVCCRRPRRGNFQITKSFQGGMQLHCGRVGKKPQWFAYSFKTAHAGKYDLVAQVVTINPTQRLLLTVNHAAAPIAISIPYTGGMWQTVGPIEISLLHGRNVLHFARGAKHLMGLTLKAFTLAPVH